MQKQQYISKATIIEKNGLKVFDQYGKEIDYTTIKSFNIVYTDITEANGIANGNCKSNGDNMIGVESSDKFNVTYSFTNENKVYVTKTVSITADADKKAEYKNGSDDSQSGLNKILEAQRKTALGME